MPNYIYYENAQIPIFSFLIVLLWSVVGVRVWVFLKTFCGWWSFRGASTIAISITAFLCTVYYALLLAVFICNMNMLKKRETMVHGEVWSGEYKYRDPHNYSDADVQHIIDHMILIIKLIYSARMILTVGLWLIKYSFLFIFLETITTLTKHWRYFLHLTTFLISATLLVAIWSIVKDMTHGLWSLVPTGPLIRAGIGYYGARFIFLDFELELILVIANIVTDICLIAIAYQTVRSFRLPLRAVLFPCALISVGVLVAFGRLALIILTRNAPDYTTFATIPFELFAELETFISVFIACIPGLRVFVRRRQEIGWHRRSSAYQVGAEMGVLAGGGGMSVLESSGGEVPASSKVSAGRLWRTLSAGVEKGREGKDGKRKEKIKSDGAVFLSGEEFLR